MRRASFKLTRVVWAVITRDPRLSIRELSLICGVAPSSVRVALHQLEQAGYIASEQTPGRTRSPRARRIVVPFVVITKTESAPCQK